MKTNLQSIKISFVVFMTLCSIQIFGQSLSGTTTNVGSKAVKSAVSADTHTIKLVVISGWNLIRSFEYFDGTAWVSVAYNDPAVSYTNFALHGAGFLESETAGASAKYTFTGNGIRLYGNTESYNGTGKIYIDDVYQQDVTFYANPGVRDVLIYEKTGLISVVPSAVETVQNNDVKIYTNSATNVLHIANAAKNAAISIFSIDGKLVSSIKSTGSEMQIDVAGWNKGVYVLSIRSNQKNMATKLVIR